MFPTAKPSFQNFLSRSVISSIIAAVTENVWIIPKVAIAAKSFPMKKATTVRMMIDTM